MSPAIARRADPGTSRAAARSVSSTTITEVKLWILCQLVGWGPLTNLELEQHAAEHAAIRPYLRKPQTIRSRRAELTEAGLVEPTDRTKPSDCGRACIVWTVTAKGRKALEEMLGLRW